MTRSQATGSLATAIQPKLETALATLHDSIRNDLGYVQKFELDRFWPHVLRQQPALAQAVADAILETLKPLTVTQLMDLLHTSE